MDAKEDIRLLTRRFAACSKTLSAIGDETRQHLILEMLKLGDCNGVRVGDITATSNLSRPAVSHHLKILKDAGIVRVRKEGTKNYYYFDPVMAPFRQLVETLEFAMALSSALPHRGGEEE